MIHNLRTTLLLPAVLAVCAVFGLVGLPAQVTGLLHPGGLGDGQGSTLVAAGDLNGDGCVDFVIGSPLDDANGYASGRVEFVSGASGAVLASFHGTGSVPQFPYSVGAHLGAAVASLPDLDGDSVQDVLVAAPRKTIMAPFAGRIEILSGATGLLIRAHDGNLPGEMLGRLAQSVPDFDLDGLPDYAFGGVSVFPGSYLPRPYVRVHSAATGALLLEVLSPSPAQNGFASRFCGIDDLDQDGFPDLVLAQWGMGTGSVAGGGVITTVSGTSGAILSTIIDADPTLLFGRSLLALSDIDQDGRPDFAVGAPRVLGSGAGDDELRFYSGAYGFLIQTTLGAADSRFGESLASAGDQDGDGLAEILVGAPYSDLGGLDSGEVQVVGQDGILRAVVPGATPGLKWGSQVAGGFDLNGDGYPDWIAAGRDPLALSGTLGRNRVVLNGSFVGSDGAGGIDSLALSGSAGGPGRVFRVDRFQPFQLQLESPAGPTPFVLWGALGKPAEFTPFSTGLGNLVFTPQAADPADPRLFTIADALFPGDPYALVAAPPGSFTLNFPIGFPIAARVILQGLAIDPANGGLVTTNALMLHVR